MGQTNSVNVCWTFIITKDDEGKDCAVLHNAASGTVLELCGSSTGWFAFMDRSDEPEMITLVGGLVELRALYSDTDPEIVDEDDLLRVSLEHQDDQLMQAPGVRC